MAKERSARQDFTRLLKSLKAKPGAGFRPRTVGEVADGLGVEPAVVVEIYEHMTYGDQPPEMLPGEDQAAIATYHWVNTGQL